MVEGLEKVSYKPHKSLGTNVRNIYTSYALDALDSKSREALKYYSKLAGSDKFGFDKRINGMRQWINDYFSSDVSENNKKIVGNAMREMNAALRNYVCTESLGKNSKFLPAIRELEDKILAYKPQPVVPAKPEVQKPTLYQRLKKGVRNVAAGTALLMAACAGGPSPQDYEVDAKNAYASYEQLSSKGVKNKFSVGALKYLIDAHDLFTKAENADPSEQQYEKELKTTSSDGSSIAPKVLSTIDDRLTFVELNHDAQKAGFLKSMSAEDAQRYDAALRKHGVGPYEGKQPDQFAQEVVKKPEPTKDPDKALDEALAQTPEPEKPKPVEQPKTEQPKPVEQPTPQPPQAPPAEAPEVPGVYRVTTDTFVASNQSTQQRKEYLTLQTPYVDGLMQWHSNRMRVPELDGHDRISESGFGGNLTGKIFFIEAGVTYSQSVAKRDHPADNSVTTTPPFIITTSTDVDETNEKTFVAGNVKAKLGSFTPKLTLYQDLEELAVDVSTDVDVDNTADPAGDHAYTINDTISAETTRQGLQAGIDYTEKNVNAGFVGSVERTEVSMGDDEPRKWDVYSGTVYGGLKGDDDSFGVSAGIGKRLTDDSEKHCRFDPLHWYANGAVDLGEVEGQNVTGFGSFWRLTDPAGGLGLVIGQGPAVSQVMQYYNARAFEHLDLLKHLGSEERKVYVTQMMNDFRRGISADNNLRLMLFGGARRNESYAPEDLGKDKKQIDWIADVVLSIPVWQDPTNKDNYFTLAPYFTRDANGRESYIGGGIEAVMPGGIRARVGGGQLEVPGAKHEKAPAVTFGLEWPF